MTRKIPLTVLGAGLAMAMLAGCGDSSGTQIAQPAPAATPKETPTISAEKAHPGFWPADNPLADPASSETVHYGAGFSSQPAPDKFVPALTADEALRIVATTQDFGVELQPGEPSITLRTVQLTPEAPEEVAWLFTWQDSKLALRGPSTSPEERERAINQATCVFVVTLNAKTEEPSSAGQFCA